MISLAYIFIHIYYECNHCLEITTNNPIHTYLNIVQSNKDYFFCLSVNSF